MNETNPPKTINDRIIKYYFYSKKMMIAQITLSIISIVIIALWVIFILLGIDINSTNPPEQQDFHMIYLLMILLLLIILIFTLIALIILNLVWSIQSLCLRTEDQDLDQLLLMLGIVGLVMMILGFSFFTWILQLILIKNIKTTYPDFIIKTPK
ncbi:MAG: hypothetical protein ACRCVI_02445 [Mycoplasmoidaceae bacterium]